jgi:hypothetical protein
VLDGGNAAARVKKRIVSVAGRFSGRLERTFDQCKRVSAPLQGTRWKRDECGVPSVGMQLHLRRLC